MPRKPNPRVKALQLLGRWTRLAQGHLPLGAGCSCGAPAVSVRLTDLERDVLGPLRLIGEKDGLWTFDVSYSLFQTTLEGESRLFSVGRYRVEARLEGGAARLKTVTVIADTGLVPSLLATPI